MRIYVACLAAYNNGFLHGRWIDATADADEMQEEISAMLRASPCPNVQVDCVECMGVGESFPGVVCRECGGRGAVDSAEEWAIHDMEGLPSCFGEYSGLEPVAEFVALVEEYDWIDAEDLAKIVTDAGSVEQALEQLENDFVGIYDSFRDYADEHADEVIRAYVSEANILAQYFDYDAFARDLRMGMHTVDLNGGRVAVFHA